MFVFLNNLSWLDKIGLFFAVLCVYSNIIGFIRYRLTLFNLSKGKVIKSLEEFPVHTTSPDGYLTSKKKVEEFANSLLTGQKAELSLNQEDINNLYTKGIVLNKYITGKYLYYQIQKDLIIEKLIEGPVFFFFSSNPYRARTKEISFSHQKLECYRRITEEYGRKIKETKQSFPLDASVLILFILGGLRSPDGTFYGYQETVEYQKATSLIKKINSVEISNGHLILRA